MCGEKNQTLNKIFKISTVEKRRKFAFISKPVQVTPPPHYKGNKYPPNFGQNSAENSGAARRKENGQRKQKYVLPANRTWYLYFH